MKQVFTKSRIFHGKTTPSEPTEFSVKVKNNKTITIFFKGEEGRTFKIGDVAEYDSWNLKYTGTITKITENTVTVVKYPGSSMSKTIRMDMNKFCWRNFSFDEEATAKYNANEMMYL